MKRIFSRLLAPLLVAGCLLSTSSANLSYSNGDLLLGVRATAEPGSTQAYVLNLGPAAQFVQATGSFAVPNLGNVAQDLATFSESGGAAWSARPDVLWGVVGTDLAGDPANTLYATRSRSNVNEQSLPWQRRSNSSQSGTNSIFRAFFQGFTLSAANAASARGTIQQTSDTNSYASFVSGGTDFGFFSSIEGNFGAGTAGSVLDLYRLAPTTQNLDGDGEVFVGTFQFNDAGVLTFTAAPPPPPSFRFSTANYNVAENGVTLTVTVVRTANLSGTDSVQFDTSNGTAIADANYTAKNNFTVNFAPSQASATVTVDIIEVSGFQGNQTFQVALSNPSTGGLGLVPTATVTIADSSPQNFGAIAFSSATYSAPPVNGQGGPNLVPITINRATGSDGAVTVDLSVAAGGNLATGTDFTGIGAPTTVQFANGETSKTVNIQLAALADDKLPGTINLSLANPQGGVALGATTTATVTITARDLAKPAFKLTSKPGKVPGGLYQVAGTATDDSAVGRVEVVVNGGAPQLATLQSPGAASTAFNLAGIALENGKNTVVVTTFDTSGNAAKSVTVKLIYANERPELAGAYNGLVSAAVNQSNNTTGFVNLKVTKLGAFTGKVTIGEATLPIKGLFDNAGDAHFNVTGDTTAAPESLLLAKKKGAVTTEFGNLALSIAPDKVTGTLQTDAALLIANVDADRAFFDGKTPGTTVPASYLQNKGSYTVLFPARDSQPGLGSADYPQGTGFGTLKLTSKGVATLKGTLADGAAFTSAAPISKNFEWPLFAKLYKKLGVVLGEVTFDDTQADTDLEAAGVIWIRPPQPTAKHYPNGWTAGILLDLIGAKYDAKKTGGVLPGLGAENTTSGNADLTLAKGNLANSPLTKTVSISAANKVTNAPADKSFKLSISAATGLFSGSFTHSDTTKPALKGAIYQKGSTPGGHGFFLSTVPNSGPTGESGSVVLEAK